MTLPYREKIQARMVSLRIRDDKLARIDDIATEARMSRTAWMVEAALNYEQPEPKDELGEIRRRLDALEQIAGL